MNNAMIEPGDHDGDEADDGAGAATEDATAKAVTPNKGFDVRARPLGAATGLADITAAAARGGTTPAAETAGTERLAAAFRFGNAGWPAAVDPERAGMECADDTVGDLPPPADVIARVPRLGLDAFAEAPGESDADAPASGESACATGDVAASAAPRPRVTAEAPNHAYGISRRFLPRRPRHPLPFSGGPAGESPSVSDTMW